MPLKIYDGEFAAVPFLRRNPASSQQEIPVLSGSEIAIWLPTLR